VPQWAAISTPKQQQLLKLLIADVRLPKTSWKAQPLGRCHWQPRNIVPKVAAGRHKSLSRLFMDLGVLCLCVRFVCFKRNIISIA